MMTRDEADGKMVEVLTRFAESGAAMTAEEFAAEFHVHFMATDLRRVLARAGLYLGGMGGDRLRVARGTAPSSIRATRGVQFDGLVEKIGTLHHAADDVSAQSPGRARTVEEMRDRDARELNRMELWTRGLTSPATRQRPIDDPADIAREAKLLQASHPSMTNVEAINEVWRRRGLPARGV